VCDGLEKKKKKKKQNGDRKEDEEDKKTLRGSGPDIRRSGDEEKKEEENSRTIPKEVRTPHHPPLGEGGIAGSSCHLPSFPDGLERA
jgi:hypothetical protein